MNSRRRTYAVPPLEPVAARQAAIRRPASLKGRPELFCIGVESRPVLPPIGVGPGLRPLSVLGLGSWVLGLGSWVLGLGSWVLGLGSWVLGLGSWVLGLGSWVLT